MKLGICNEMFEGRPIEEVFEFASETGYDGVEIAPFTLAETGGEISPARRKDIAAAAANAGIDIIGLHWLLISPKGLYINHPDESIRTKTRDYLIELIDLCGDLSGRVMVLGSPEQRNIIEGETYDAMWQRAVKTFRECMGRAAERGVTLCIEQLAARETDFISTPEEAAKIVDEVGHPNLKMILDVKAMSSLGRPVPDTLRMFGPGARHIHANEADGNGPGTGDTDFVPVFKALDEFGYDGYVSVEVFDFSPGAEKIARDSFRYLARARAEALGKSD